MKHRPNTPQQARGFTLVEVLVALLSMALLSALAWRGLDSVMRSRDAARDSVDSTVRLATVLAQWDQDLGALHDTQAVPALQFDGQTLRLTRRNGTGVSLVTWALRSGAWQRWVSPPYTRQADLQRAWQQSQQFLGNEAGQLAVARGASEWQLYFFRGGWSNAQSSADLRVMTAPPRPTPSTVRAAPAPPTPSSPPSSPPSPPPPSPSTGSGSAADAAAAEAAAAARGTQAAAPPTGVPPPPPVVVQQLPEAVRLVITLGGRKLTRDVLLGPASS